MDKIPAEKKDSILKDAQARLDKYSAEGKGIDKYSVDLKYWLEKQSGVRQATLRGRKTLTVEFDDSSRVGILLDRMQTYGGKGQDDHPSGYAPSVNISRHIERMPWISRIPVSNLMRASNTPTSTKALLFDPLYDDWPPESTTDAIYNALHARDYDVDQMLGNDADLAHLEQIESNEYGVIFIRSHGGVMFIDGDDKINIMTRPFFDTFPDPSTSGYNGIEVFHVNTNWGYKYAFAFNEEFVRHHLASTNFPNTLMHLLVCHGGDPAGTDDLIDAFMDFGVGCFTGWTRNATPTHGDPAAVEFFEYLCGDYGRTVLEAIELIESAGHSPDPSTGADLVCYGSGNMSIIGLRRIELDIPEQAIEMLRKFPNQQIELIVKPPKGIRIPDWSPFGGKLTPVDRIGRRQLISFHKPEQAETSERMMEEALRVF